MSGWSSDTKSSPPASSSSSSKSSQLVPASLCNHSGNVLVFQVGQLRVYGGGATRGARPKPDMLVIDLANQVSSQPVKILGILSLPRIAKYTACTVVKIDWTDGSVPALDRDFWKALVQDITDLAVQQPLDVLVMCMGGHGRTGTALSILATLFGVVPQDSDPVKWIREHYCPEAVESNSQLDYVEEITGHVVAEEASWKSATGGKNYYAFGG